MNLFVVLVLSIISIISLLIGTLIVFSTKNNDKVITFSVSLGFIVLLLLGIFHLIPDAYEFLIESSTKPKSILLIALFSVIGFGIIALMDILGGHHNEHTDKDAKEVDHFKHISLITCIFLVIHNFIEGITLYSTVLINYETAVILTLGICLHNIPLGLTLSSTFDKFYSKIKTVLFITLIGFSYLLGALVLYNFNEFIMNPFILGMLLCFTFGMIIYISIFEFLPLLRESKEKKIRNYGLIAGFLIMLLTLLG